MSLVDSAVGTAGPEERACAAAARFLLALPGAAWPPAEDACLLVRAASGQELARGPRRGDEADPALVPAGVAFELLAHSRGLSRTLSRGRLDLAPPVAAPDERVHAPER